MNGLNGQWKWIAGILAALMIGAFPGCVAYWRAPTGDDFDRMEANQQEILERVAILEVQNDAVAALLKEARDELSEHQQQQGG